MLLVAVGFAACDETDEVGEFDNWQARNVAYVDSIARIATSNVDGTWKKFLAYGLVDTVKWENQYYVYCKVLESGEGSEMPKYTDIVKVNYRGRLIPTSNYPDGRVFDQSYEGDLDPETDVPTSLSLAGCVRGWTTAVCEMVKGDVWRVYVPSELGYGATDQSAVPAHSTLVFDINLVDFSKMGSSAY